MTSSNLFSLFRLLLHLKCPTMIVAITGSATRSTQSSFHLSNNKISLYPAFLFFVLFGVSKSVNSFSAPTQYTHVSRIFENMAQRQQTSLYQSKLPSRKDEHSSVCELPGDPSLILTTNVDLGSMKMDIMKGKNEL